MSESITHTAVVDDTIRLVRMERAPICAPFKTVLARHRDIARLGGITRHGDRHNPGLLEHYRSQWEAGAADKAVGAKLAFVLGWLSHRAADRTAKPVFRELDGSNPQSPTDCSIYHDVCVLQEVYAGADKPDALGKHMLLDGTDANPGNSEALFHAYWRRMLVRMHTFIPDDTDPDRWLEHVIKMQQRLYVDLRRYAEAWKHPDPEKVDRFLTKPNFYNRHEPLLRLVRGIQCGDNVDDIDLADALATAANGSLYAYMLARAYRYCRAASDFFDRRIEMGELTSRLDIGRPELAG